MRHFYFELTNLKTDAVMCFVPTLKAEDIEMAIKLHEIEIENIGIQVKEIYPDCPKCHFKETACICERFDKEGSEL